MMLLRVRRIATVIVAIFVVSTYSSATPIATTGTWDNVLPANVDNLAGVGTNTITWGNPAPPPLGSGNPSAYIFDGVNSDIDLPAIVGEMVTFPLGDFTHDNQTLFAGVSLEGATLDLELTLGPLVDTFSFDFLHNETPNMIDQPPDTPCPDGGVVGTTGCPDVVGFPSNPDDPFFTFMGMVFQLEITGFMTDDGFVSEFLTAEQMANTAVLQGKITKIVPEPATTGMLAVGMVFGALGLRRRTRATL